VRKVSDKAANALVGIQACVVLLDAVNMSDYKKYETAG
jgi:hypothetical protein